LALSFNSYVETTSSISLRFVEQPQITQLSPTRTIAGSNSTLTITGEGFIKEAPNPQCAFYQGDASLATVSANIVSSRTALCEIPTNLTAVREVQRIRMVGLMPTPEVQAIEVTAQPN